MSKEVFSKKITQSDAFLGMPLSTQALYFHLCEDADDDGFVNKPKTILRTIGAAEDDYKLLIAKKFILTFESGVIVIKHWRMHNLIQMYDYKPTDYVEEMRMLKVKENKAYTLSDDGEEATITIETKGDSKEMNNVMTVLDKWNELEKYGVKPISKLTANTQRCQWLLARIREYGTDNVLKAIDNIAESDFLLGKSGSRPFIITFDWFVRPNNFPKVLDGNYNNKSTKEIPYVPDTKSEWQ